MVMADPSPQSGTARIYDVYFYVAGGPRLFLHNPNHGVTISDAGLAWINYGQPRNVPFADIAAIHLSCGAIGQQILDQCKINFNDGAAITLANWNDKGLPDEKQLSVYRACMNDLHARLAAREQNAIRFTAGFPQWRYNVLLGAAICGALLWLSALLAVLFVAPSLQGIGILTGALFISVPVVKLLRKNAPRSYTPDNPPGELLS
jgi:hypothetical protein